MAIANYATTADVSVYLPNVKETEQDAIWTAQLSVASRAVDGFCDRYFYSDGPATKYFDGDDTDLLIVPQDFYSLTAISIANFENGQPSTSDWTTLTGDGSTPPSDFFLEPANELYVGKAGDTNRKPFYRVRIPDTPPATSTTFMTVFTKGRRTVSINATWGWPSVPDEIKDIVVKIVVRMWRAREAGYGGAVGDPADGPQQMLDRFLDPGDFRTLSRYKRYSGIF